MKEVNETPNWTAILKHLAESDIDFLVVGGAALVLHGIPRTTLDIDIYIPSDAVTLRNLINLNSQKLFLTEKVNLLDKLIDNPSLLIGQWIPFGIADGPDLLDVYACRTGEFNKLHENAEIIDFHGSKIHIISIENLKEMKKASGRPIDLADLALIEEFEKLI